MSLMPIILHPGPRLKKVCAPVDAFDDALAALIKDMFETMYDAPGVGLAGPQVGVMKRVVVMDCADKEAPPEPLAVINPEITWSSEEGNTHEEGCLSLPDIFGDVTRPALVRVRFQDAEGATHEQEFDGLAATCIQHEIDHLNGKLFIDYLGPVRRQMITAKMKKVKKERAKTAADGA
jgi:peptide deformylase